MEWRLAVQVFLFSSTVASVGYGSWLKCCFTSTETVGLLGTEAQDVHLDFHTAPVEVLPYVHINRRIIRDGEPRTSTSTFTHLLSSVVTAVPNRHLYTALRLLKS